MNGKHFVLASLFAVVLLTVVFIPAASQQAGEYDPWVDLNDDGAIDIYDIISVATRFGAEGTPKTKASVEYDSGWIDITDKCGQYFNITHNLNSADVMLDITGKTSLSGGAHQYYLGGTCPVPGWNKTYGGANWDSATCVICTRDGGYALAGDTESFGAGGIDFWLVKTDEYGNIQWNRTYGRTENDACWSGIQTNDGGYALAGWALGFGAGSNDFWLVKTDAFGNEQWNKTYGGTNCDVAYSVIQTGDGGYALAGESASFGGFWLVKTDTSGSMQWNKTYGATADDKASSLVQTADGGYALAGETYYGGIEGDMRLVKADSLGNMQWNKTYGAIYRDYALSLIETNDGGYALAGSNVDAYMNFDFLLVKTDPSGNMQWNKTYHKLMEEGRAVIQTSDGGYVLAGNGGISLVKTDTNGNMQWEKGYSDVGWIGSFAQAADGGFVVGGDVPENNGDFWLIKMDSRGNAYPGFKHGLAWADSTANTITLYRGATDPYWNYVRVRIWKVKESP